MAIAELSEALVKFHAKTKGKNPGFNLLLMQWLKDNNLNWAVNADISTTEINCFINKHEDPKTLKWDVLKIKL